MDAFYAFIDHLNEMKGTGTTSFFLMPSEVWGFAFACMPSLVAAGLPADFDKCRMSIESGNFEMDGIRIAVGQCVRLRPGCWP